MTNKNLIIRADADQHSGIGHLMRCISLAQAWQKKGGQAVFITCCTSASLKKRIKDEGFDLITISSAYPDISDIETLRFCLKEKAGEWVVVDGYHFAPDYHKTIRENGTRLLVIDDDNHLPFYDADILLNQNLGAEKLEYNCREGCAMLLGTSFTMLRNEFLNIPPCPHIFTKKAQRLLITMGGSDPGNTTLKVIKALNQIPCRDFHIDVVMGHVSRHLDAVTRALETAPFKSRIISQTKKMHELMAHCDMAVSAGGSTAWELSYLGIPSIYILLADNQSGIITEISNAEAGINAGWHNQISTNKLAETIHALMMDKGKRMRLSMNASKLITGKGADNVVSHMMEA